MFDKYHEYFYIWRPIHNPSINALTTDDDERTHHVTLVAFVVLAKNWDRGRWAGIVMTYCAHGSCLGWL